MFTFGYLFSRMSWLNKCFHRYFSQYLSLYEVFNVHSLRKAKPLEVSSKLLYQSAFISNAFGSGQLHSFMFLTEWRWRDSNSWPPACKAGALPTELHPHMIWHSPALPYRLQYSTIGRLGLNHRVRDENGCVPQAHRHQKCSYFGFLHRRCALRITTSSLSFFLIYLFGKSTVMQPLLLPFP